jgi:hypothetical protein
MTVLRDNPRLRPIAAHVCPSARIVRIAMSALSVQFLACGILSSFNDAGLLVFLTIHVKKY